MGKTTTAVNVAAALATKGLRVLVIDLDPQGNASTALNIDHSEGTPGVYEALVDGTDLDELVRPCPDLPGLTVLPASIDLAGAEIELVSLVARETRLDKALQSYLEDCEDAGDRIDYVLIDCPPSLGLLTVNALVAGREVLIPIQCEYYALEGLGQLVRNIDLVQRHLNPRLEITTILLTMFDARTRLSSGVADEVRKFFGAKVLRTAIPRSVRISEAPSYQQTILTYDATSSGALSYLEAAREIAVPKEALMNTRRGLGRGLEALIPSTPAEAEESGLQEVDGARFAEIPLTQIVPNPRQPRRSFDEDEMSELVHSIQEVGLLQPVIVRATGAGHATSWSWGSGAGVRPVKPDSTRSAPSSATRPTTTCCATPCWRTCTGRSSTRWKRRRPTNSCWTTSDARTRNWPNGSADPVRRSATRCVCSSSRRPSSDGSRRACCRPAMPGRWWPSATPRSRTGSPSESSPRGCRSGRWRRS